MASASKKAAPIGGDSQPGWRRNFIVGVISAFFMQIGISTANDGMVLSLFVNQAGGSNTLVGLTPTLSETFTMLPQLFVAGRLEGKRRKMPYYLWPRAGRGLIYLFILTPALILAGKGVHSLLLPIFFLTYAVGRLLIGFSQVPRMDILAKSIPARYFELFWGQRNFWGKAAAFATSMLVGFILSERSGLAFPFNYAVLFGGGSLFLLLEVVLFSFIREPVHDGTYRTSGVKAQLSRAPRILREDRNYARFVLTRLILTTATLANPFYILYATEVLQAPVSMVGLYLPVLTLSDILSNIVWSGLAYRRGNKLLMEISVMGQVLAPLAVLGLPALLGTMGASSTTIIYAFALVFFLRGIAASASGIATTSYMLLISPPAERPTYVGLNYTILGFTSFLPILGGILADSFGYRVVFGIVAGVVGLALPVMWSLADTRQPQVVSTQRRHRE